MEAKEGLWTHSTNEEEWSIVECFATREEAVAHGRHGYGDESFWVGRLKAVPWHEMIGGYEVERFLENFEENAEIRADCALIEPTREQRDAIAEVLDATFRAELEKHGLWPVGWWMIEDMERVESPEPGA